MRACVWMWVLVFMLAYILYLCLCVFVTALWKQACDAVMTIKAPSKSKVPFTRQSSLYDETPLIGQECNLQHLLLILSIL